MALRQTDSVADGLGERQNAFVHEVLVANHRTDGGGEPAIEEVGCAYTDQESSSRSCQGLAAAKARSVATPESAKGASGCIAPAEKQDAHDTDILGERVEDDPGTQKVENDAVPARVFTLAHQSTENLDVEPVEGRISMSKPVNGGDGNESRHEPWRDGLRLGAADV